MSEGGGWQGLVALNWPTRKAGKLARQWRNRGLAGAWTGGALDRENGA
jgi:hypothetical protein